MGSDAQSQWHVRRCNCGIEDQIPTPNIASAGRIWDHDPRFPLDWQSLLPWLAASQLIGPPVPRVHHVPPHLGAPSVFRVLSSSGVWVPCTPVTGHCVRWSGLPAQGAHCYPQLGAPIRRPVLPVSESKRSAGMSAFNVH